MGSVVVEKVADVMLAEGNVARKLWRISNDVKGTQLRG